MTTPRPYLSLVQLAECTPWTTDTIRQKMRRGELRLGVHYFQPGGRRSQVLFKWAAIVELIEGRRTPVQVEEPVPAMPAGVLDYDEAEKGLQRLLS